MAVDTENLVRGLALRYLGVLVIVAALLLLDQIVLQPLLIRLNGLGPVINLAGRQRMLSQRMTKDLLAMDRNPQGAGQWRDELRESWNSWVAVHQGLQSGDRVLQLPVTSNPLVQQAFAEIEPHFQAMKMAVESQLTETPGRSQDLDQVLEHGRRYLPVMDRIVGLFEAEARQQVWTLRMLGMAVTGGVLILMTGLWYLVLRPATDTIRSQMRRLTASEERFRLLIERMHDGLAIFTPEGQIRYVNQRFAEILQRRPEELLNVPIQNLTGGQHLRNFLQYLSGVRRSTDAAWELAWQLPDRTERSTLAAFGQTRDDSTAERLAFLVITDITALKHAESELRDARDELELRVVARTQELISSTQALEREAAERKLAEERSQQLQSELAHATRVTTLGQFATGLAHEINQPLGAIANFAEALRIMLDRTPPPTDDLAKTADRIRDAALRAGQIVGRLRNFLKPKATPRSDVYLNQLVEDVLVICSPEITIHRVELEVNLSATAGVQVLVDPIQIQQVLVNLVNNAVQALSVSHGSRALRLHTVRSGDTVTVQVDDSGPGFPVEMLESGVVSFRSTKEEGLGMGLAISQSLIAAHRGQFWIENLPTRGARVNFSLPVASSLNSET